MVRPTPRSTPNRSFDGSHTLAQLRCKVPIVYNGAPHMCPQNYPFPWTDPQTQLPTSSLDPSDLPSQTTSRYVHPFFHNPLDRQTHRQTNRSLAGKFDHYRPLTLYRQQRGLIVTLHGEFRHLFGTLAVPFPSASCNHASSISRRGLDDATVDCCGNEESAGRATAD